MKKDHRSHIERELQRLIDIQLTDGNWNYDQYMRGLANGLLLAMSVVNGKDPKFLEDIELYKIDFKRITIFNNSGIVLDTDEKSEPPIADN